MYTYFANERRIGRMKSFRIKNIKSFKDSGEIEIKPITIFVGKNSCGKSSLLRFPIVLAQTATSNTDSPIMFYGKMLDYGNYEDVVFGGKKDNIEFAIHYDVNINDLQDERYRVEEEIIASNTEDVKDTWMKICVGKKDNKMYVDTVELYVENMLISGFYYNNDVYIVKLNSLYVEGNFLEEKYELNLKSVEFDTFFPIYDSKEKFSSIVELVYDKLPEYNDEKKIQELYNKLYNNVNPFGDDDYTDQERKIMRISGGFDYASTLMSHVYQRFKIESIITTYIGPFRESPERVYRDSETQSRNVGVKGENVSTLLIRDFHKNNKLIEAISEWLNKTMGYNLQIKDMGSNLFQIMLVNREGVESNILDVGFGISQVLPIVTQIIRSLIWSQKYIMGKEINEETIYIEQPELHLHPAAQADLADLFVNCVLENNNGKRIVIETHSEHLIRKLQVLIADKNNMFTNEMIKIYYVDKDEQGVANVEEMKILPNGKFQKRWPSGFFDKAHELSMELLKNS